MAEQRSRIKARAVGSGSKATRYSMCDSGLSDPQPPEESVSSSGKWNPNKSYIVLVSYRDKGVKQSREFPF